MKKVPVYSIDIMHQLIRKGFTCIKIADNKLNPIYKVFFFENTPELLKALEECK